MTATTLPDTRERLLQATAGLLWEKSFQATSVDDLCSRAEAKKGSFYHFFASKTDIAIAAIENTWEQTRLAVFEPIFSSDASGLTQIRNLVDTVHDYQTYLAQEKEAYLGCPFGNLGQEMARQDERIRVVLHKIFLAHCNYLQGALERAVQAKEIPAGNAVQRAQRLFALLEGAFLLAKVANDPAVFKQALANVEIIAAS